MKKAGDLYWHQQTLASHADGTKTTIPTGHRMASLENRNAGTKRPLVAEETASTKNRAQNMARPEESTEMFHNLANWIRSSKCGFVHPDIEFVEPTRELRLIAAATAIPAGEIVLCIPRPNLVCPSNIAQWSKISQTLQQKMNKGKDGLFHSIEDCIVATYLASKPSKIRPYFDSLPSKSLDNLPRRWPSKKLDRLLGGSPLLRRIKEQQHEILKDFAKVQEYLAGDDDLPKIDLQSFDDAMAVVTSRAFVGKVFDNGSNASCGEEPTMVPLLDLCNHERGTILPKKNLSYEFEPDCVLVRSLKGIASGDTLRITYGAQGNAQLLFNYGFAIPNNMEPDGSSNDTYEFFSADDKLSKGIFLRMGPKSYSYGCFVQALELFIDVPSASNNEIRNDDGSVNESDAFMDGPDDMEAFLNECDEEQENIAGDDDGDDEDFAAGESYFGTDIKGMNEGDEGELKKEDEIKGLLAFRSRLRVLANSYVVPEKERTQHFDSPNHSPEKYAAIVVISELSTIHFFARAIEGVINSLDPNHGFSSSDPLPQILTSRRIDEEHVSDLVHAYMTIRH